jgi:RNA polymerase sigma-70 factor (ECF subfamily)
MNERVQQVLVDNHRKFLAFLQRRVGSREVAEDILQEAFVRGVQRADSIRDEESATAWFYRMLRNALVDHYRKRGTEARALEGLAAETGTTQPSPDDELMGTVCDCIGSLVETLKDEYAAAIRRVDLGGSSVKDFAAEAGITPNNAAVRVHRAREALRRQVVRVCGTCATHGCSDCRCKESSGKSC